MSTLLPGFRHRIADPDGRKAQAMQGWQAGFHRAPPPVPPLAGSPYARGFAEGEAARRRVEVAGEGEI